MDYWYRLLKVCFHFVSSCLKRDPCGHYTNRGDCSQTNTDLKGGGAGTARKMWPIHSKQTDKWVSSRLESHLWILIVKTKFLRSKAWLIWLGLSTFDMQASIESDLYCEKSVSPVAFSTGSTDISHHMTLKQELVQRFNYNKNRVFKYNWHVRLLLE